MKDMPTLQPAGLAITAVLPREDVRDALVAPSGGTFVDLPPGSVVGTSSVRRAAQLRHRRPDLGVVEFRGSVETRLRKLAEGVAAATFLAMAGLNRLRRDDVPRVPIDPEEMLPAIAQGAIGLEQRAGDDRTAALLAPIHHAATGHRLAAERAFLAGLDGSCQTPIAGLAELDGDRLRLRGEILRPDGSERLAHEVTGSIADAVAIGVQAAAVLRGRAGRGFFD
jgi:hydroxymethylbilane synthase